jgi:hypothetical protein
MSLSYEIDGVSVHKCAPADIFETAAPDTAALEQDVSIGKHHD